jgi:hypothetical protein
MRDEFSQFWCDLWYWTQVVRRAAPCVWLPVRKLVFKSGLVAGVGWLVKGLMQYAGIS